MKSIKEQSKALVVFSGGQDSTYCLYWALNKFDLVYAITFNYGQKHKIELDAANKIISIAALDYPGKIAGYEVFNFDGSAAYRSAEQIEAGSIPRSFKSDVQVLQGTSPLVNSEETLEQYESHEVLPGGLEKTFVPMRNQLFLTVAANRAFCLGINNLVTGVCQEDNGGYPDCTREFITTFELVSTVGTFTHEADFPLGLYVHTPLMDLTKAQTVKAALEIPGCYAATAWSHTSYDGAYPPTGHDHATLLRAKGFEEANIPDPLILRANQEGLMILPKTANYGKMLINTAYAKMHIRG